MARLPVTNADDGVWGDVLNAFLLATHNADGTLRNGSVSEASLDSAARTKLNSIGTVVDGSITEAKLSSAVQTKINVPAGVSSVNTRNGAVTLTQTDVGLANVDNTSDLNKPISTATQTALNAKAALSHTHSASQISDATAIGASVITAVDAAAVRVAIGAGTSNLTLGTSSSTAKAGDYTPTKADVGLANVDNTSDLNKPISTATQTALNAKVDSVNFGATVLLINDAGSLPAGTPAGVIVVVKA